MIQIERIREKIKQLKKRDDGFVIFGSDNHSYRLNTPLPLHKVHQFEKDNGILLPEGYIQFITEIGNGGAGPFYGLEPLENSLFQDLDYKNHDALLNPSMPFPHSSSWNMEFNPTTEDEESEEYENQLNIFQEKYYDPKYVNGAIAICNYGCAMTLMMVVNGTEYGNIWMDDRTSNKGVYPSCELGNSDRITFLDWYEKWLDDSLLNISST